jgi:hypothetical protein
MTPLMPFLLFTSSIYYARDKPIFVSLFDKNLCHCCCCCFIFCAKIFLKEEISTRGFTKFAGGSKKFQVATRLEERIKALMDKE